jgi:hypothetical protein
MDLLASSGGSVPAAAKRMAVRKWAGRRQFWARMSTHFAVSMGAVGSAGQIRRCHRRGDALMCVAVEGRRGGRERRDEEDQKSNQTRRQIRVTGLTTKTRCALVDANNSTKKFGQGTMFRCHHTNSSALNTMVPFKWSENGETLF